MKITHICQPLKRFQSINCVCIIWLVKFIVKQMKINSAQLKLWLRIIVGIYSRGVHRTSMFYLALGVQK